MSAQTTHDLILPVELAGGPSVDVWAPTASLLPSLDVHAAGPVDGDLRLRQVIDGRLTMWALSEDGEWLGLVAYDVGVADDDSLPQRVSHWLPARVLKPRDEGAG